MALNDSITDANLLTMLDMKADGFTNREIGQCFGKTPGPVARTFKVIREETDAVDETPDLNGTMPKRWWQAGLQVVGRQAS